MAYDEARGRIVVHGGTGSGAGSISGPEGTWLYGGVVKAALATIGAACSGSNGPPGLTAALPFLGNAAFVVDILGARPAGVAA